jgi:hypothetical protein
MKAQRRHARMVGKKETGDNGHSDSGGNGIGSLTNDVDRLAENVGDLQQAVETIRGDIAGNILVTHTRCDAIEKRLDGIATKVDRLIAKVGA